MRGKSYRGRRVLVVGLARSGLAAVEFLLRRGARVRANDQKQVEELSPRVRELVVNVVDSVQRSPDFRPDRFRPRR